MKLTHEWIQDYIIRGLFGLNSSYPQYGIFDSENEHIYTEDLIIILQIIIRFCWFIFLIYLAWELRSALLFVWWENHQENKYKAKKLDTHIKIAVFDCGFWFISLRLKQNPNWIGSSRTLYMPRNINILLLIARPENHQGKKMKKTHKSRIVIFQ